MNHRLIQAIVILFDITALLLGLTLAQSLLRSENFELAKFLFNLVDNTVTVGLLVCVVLLVRRHFR
jgi:hypothetical protein